MSYFLYSKSKEPDVVFETDSVFTSTIIRKTVATGSIIPRREIEIKSQVSGVVDRIFVEAGQVAQKGQLLSKIRIIPNSVALNNAQTQLRSARINYENSKKEMERQEQLFREKIISEVEYNAFKLDFELRDETLAAAESNLQLVREGASKKAGTATRKAAGEYGRFRPTPHAHLSGTQPARQPAGPPAHQRGRSVWRCSWHSHDRQHTGNCHHHGLPQGTGGVRAV
jgi:multidrug efflux pump subunit AcrA (membrane-fusion protein)